MGISCAIVGFIVGAVGMTGLGQVIAMNIIMFAGGKLWAALISLHGGGHHPGNGSSGNALLHHHRNHSGPGPPADGSTPAGCPFLRLLLRNHVRDRSACCSHELHCCGARRCKTVQVAVSALGLALSGLLLPYLFVYNPDLLFIDFILPKYLLDLATAALGSSHCLAA